MLKQRLLSSQVSALIETPGTVMRQLKDCVYKLRISVILRNIDAEVQGPASSSAAQIRIRVAVRSLNLRLDSLELAESIEDLRRPMSTAISHMGLLKLGIMSSENWDAGLWANGPTHFEMQFMPIG